MLFRSSLWRHLGVTTDGQPIAFEALTAIHYAHRLMAYVVLAALGYLLYLWYAQETQKYVGNNLLKMERLRLQECSLDDDEIETNVQSVLQKLDETVETEEADYGPKQFPMAKFTTDCFKQVQSEDELFDMLTAV